MQLISNGDFGGGGANKGKGSPVAISSATDYDPQGDGEEVGSKVELAVDGDPTGTAWETEHYESDTFAGTKTGPDPGVGIYVTTTSPAKPAKMIVRTPTPGWDAQVFAAASGPPEDLSEWGEPVGIVVDASSTRRSTSPSPEPATYFLLWFNKASEAHDQYGGYQVEISDIKLLRRPDAEGRVIAGLRTRRSGRAAWRSTARVTGDRRGLGSRGREPARAWRRRWSR